MRLAATPGESVEETALRYLNRLSDLLFVFARHENARRGVADVAWSTPDRLSFGCRVRFARAQVSDGGGPCLLGRAADQRADHEAEGEGDEQRAQDRAQESSEQRSSGRLRRLPGSVTSHLRPRSSRLRSGRSSTMIRSIELPGWALRSVARAAIARVSARGRSDRSGREGGPDAGDAPCRRVGAARCPIARGMRDGVDRRRSARRCRRRRGRSRIAPAAGARAHAGAPSSSPARSSAAVRSGVLRESDLLTKKMSGHSRMPAFMNWIRSPAAGCATKTRVSTRSIDLGLGLTDADGLDEDRVEGGGQDVEARARDLGEAAEPIARRQRAQEDARVRAPSPVACDRRAARRPCAGSRGRPRGCRRVRPRLRRPETERVEQRRLAGARCAGDADARAVRPRPSSASSSASARARCAGRSSSTRFRARRRRRGPPARHARRARGAQARLARRSCRRHSTPRRRRRSRP